MSEPLSREERMRNIEQNLKRAKETAHTGSIAAAVTASVCTAAFDLADALNNIADALRGSERSSAMHMAEESVKRHQSQVSSDMRPMR